MGQSRSVIQTHQKDPQDEWAEALSRSWWMEILNIMTAHAAYHSPQLFVGLV